MPSDLAPVFRSSSGRGGAAHPWLIALSAGALYFACAYLSRSLTRNGHLAAVWPCSAVLLTFLLRSQPKRWPGLLAAGFMGSVLANGIGQPVATALGLSAANVVEVLLAVWIIRRARPGRLDLSRPRDLIVFTSAAIAAPVPAAFMASAVLEVTLNAPMAATFLSWMAAASLGYLIVTPVLLVLSAPRRIGRLFGEIGRRPWSLLVLLATLIAVFAQTRYPFLFLVPPALLFVCFELDVAGAALGIGLTAMVAVGFTLVDRGPTTLIHGSGLEQVTILQVFLAIAALGSLPVAAVLEQRRRLLKSSEHARVRARRAAVAALDANRIAGMAEQLAQVGYWRLEVRSDLLTWSPQAFKIYGLPVLPGPVDRALPVSMLHPDDRAPTRRLVQDAIARAIDFDFECRIMRADGEQRSVVMRGGCERDASGAVTYLVGAMLDVTDLKRAEVALRESDIRYRLMAENASDTILHLSLDGVVTYVSPACEAMFGYRPEEWIGHSVLERVHPDDLAGVLPIGPHLIESGRSRLNDPVYYRSRHKDGRWLWIEACPAMVRDADGQPVEVIDILRDVTARKTAEAALETALKEAEAAMVAASLSERRYRLLAENATDMISRFTLDGRITFMTQACEAILGYTPQELAGRQIPDFMHPDDVERMHESIAAYIAAGPNAPQVVLQFRARRKDGQYVWLEGQPRVLFEDGQPTGVQDVVRDVTARKAIEAELIAAREQAEAGGRAKADFLANMSHELRTPLNSILGFAEVLTRSDLPAAQARYAGLIAESGRSLLAIVNDVLDLSRLDADAVRLEATPTPLRQLVIDTVALVADQAADKGLRMRTSVAAGETVVLADPARLRQVLLNLLSNAVKFTAAGEVAVELAVEPAEAATPDGVSQVAVRLCVRDTGVGITGDQIQHLFGRFEQADTSISRRFGGTGLGLSICKGLVERMGGSISAESAPGVGSAFTVRLVLPVTDTIPAAEPARPAPALRRLKLLVAEDLAVNQELIRLVLEPQGVRIDGVADGAAAVRAAAGGSYDLILMDMQMPGMDGLEATRRIRIGGGRSARIPIVALTANVLPEQVERCRASGMDDHVGKPFTARELLDVVDRWTRTPETAPPAAETPNPGAPAPTPSFWEEAALPEADDVDHAVLDDLREAVGAAPVAGLLRALQQQLRTVLDQDEDARDAVRRQAHAVLGAAGTLGFHRASEACRTLERACMDGAALSGPAEAARAACRDAADLIDRLVRDVA